jgi:hypothetical protein
MRVELRRDGIAHFAKAFGRVPPAEGLPPFAQALARARVPAATKLGVTDHSADRLLTFDTLRTWQSPAKGQHDPPNAEHGYCSRSP